MAYNSEVHPPSSILHSPLFLAGPTAVGKSEVALQLAEQIGGEIVSVDWMQVYRGLDIGTAKPTSAERDRVPHHLIDILQIIESFDAAQFCHLAKQAITEIQTRGRVPVLCGGTGLYFKALLEGLGDAPPADKSLRSQLETTPLAELLTELAQADPIAYERIDRQNPRRVIRAVEVIRLTGKTFSSQRAAHVTKMDGGAWNMATDPEVHPPSSILHPRFFALQRSPGDLRRRIDARVDEMFARGLVAETEQLLARGLEQNQTALQALGYRQVAEHLHGKRSLPETIELVKIRTRQYAKRQMTWFRRQARLTWIHVEPEESAAKVVEKLMPHLEHEMTNDERSPNSQ